MGLVYADRLFADHDTGAHPECPARVLRCLDFLEHQPAFSALPKGKLRRAVEADILRVHRAEQWREAEALSAAGGGPLDADTVLGPKSFLTSLFAAGTALEACDRVVGGDSETAFCLLRPPGHHATDLESMGFCIFNNVAIAARYAQAVHGLQRILIVDFDVHHGNGTQDIFYADPSVHFFSIHRYPFYPGSGSATESGTAAGLGATTNVPIRFGTSRAAYRDAFRSGLDKAVAAARPELILISAGFDAHKDDPIGSLGLEDEDFRDMTTWTMEAAKPTAQGRVLSCLEGGYNLGTLPRLIYDHIKTLSRFEK